MKKMLFLMLFLGTLGTVGTNAQVRIGGNGQPNTAAVLDLNATDATINGIKGLALPRVNLASTTDKLGYSTLLNGMLVYNTNATSGAGVYYWDTNKWVKVSDGAFVEVDGIVGNEFSDTIPGGGLTKTGNGTDANPYKIGIKTGGIVGSMVEDGALPVAKLAPGLARVGRTICFDGNKWNDSCPGIPYTTKHDPLVLVPATADHLTWAGASLTFSLPPRTQQEVPLTTTGGNIVMCQAGGGHAGWNGSQTHLNVINESPYHRTGSYWVMCIIAR